MGVTLPPGKQFASEVYSFDLAITPDCAVVAVWVNNLVSCDLWVNYGVLNEDGTISWHKSPANYDSGLIPSIAVDADGRLFEIHESNSFFSTSLWYHLGTAGRDGFQLYGSSTVNEEGTTFNGANPSIRISPGGTIVVLYQSRAGEFNVNYLCGAMAGNTVAWGAQHRISPEGSLFPRFDINENNVLVSAFFKNDMSDAPILIRTALVQNGVIVYQPGGDTSMEGQNPAVALDADNRVYLIYEAGGSVYFRRGAIDSVTYSITWSAGPAYIAEGNSPSIAIRGRTLVYGYKKGSRAYCGTMTIEVERGS